jgi:hypothetical protein
MPLSAATIMALVNGLLQTAVPALISLYDKIKSGGTVTDADVEALLTQYSIDRAKAIADAAAIDAAAALSAAAN